jgi:phage-related protein
MSTSDDGKINSVNLQLSNISRAMFTFAEDTNGLIDVPVVVRLVNTGHLTEDYTNLTLNFTIIGTSVDQEWLTFTLGGPNPLRRRFPQDKYVALYCNWAYKSAECNYTGGLATCKRTKADCASHNNLANFGGYPGLRPDGIRVL